MNSKQLKKISSEIDVALAEIAKKHGLNFNRGNVLWTAAGFKFKGVEFTETTENGLDAAAVEEFNHYAKFSGIKLEALNQEFTTNGDVLKIIGWKNKNRKDKVLLEQVNTGDKLKASLSLIKTLLPKKFLVSSKPNHLTIKEI